MAGTPHANASWSAERRARQQRADHQARAGGERGRHRPGLCPVQPSTAAAAEHALEHGQQPGDVVARGELGDNATVDLCRSIWLTSRESRFPGGIQHPPTAVSSQEDSIASTRIRP
ncbi:MAG: hypothetical protein R3E65_10205 [Steroidobacteraceae bacterium]